MTLQREIRKQGRKQYGLNAPYKFSIKVYYKPKKLNEENLTVEKLREFKGFENVGDEEAQEIVASIQELSIILYEFINQDLQ